MHAGCERNPFMFQRCCQEKEGEAVSLGLVQVAAT